MRSEKNKNDNRSSNEVPEVTMDGIMEMLEENEKCVIHVEFQEEAEKNA